MTFQPLTDFEDSHEIEIDVPHRIRKIGSNAFLSIWIDTTTGYAKVSLNGQSYQYHRILARHFIPNPDDLPQVDHIDRNPLNNSIDNLRWISASDNGRNRGRYTQQRREYLTAPPNDLIEITQYNDFEYPPNKYFFCGENDRIVLRINDHRWQLLAQTQHQGYLRINMKDINGQKHNIYVHKIIEHFRNEQVDA